MSDPTAARVIRSSQGDEDKIGLELQREETTKLADRLGADIVNTLDLGIHTGFSSFTKGTNPDNRIDNNPEVAELIDDIREGIYDYLLAYNDTRLARDDFFFMIQYACIQGDCEIAFVEDIDLQSIAFRTTRVVEQYVKLKEIRASRKARKRRRENGGREGTPPIGLEWDSRRHGWEPSDKFDEVLELIALKDAGATHREVVAASSIISSTGTVTKILERRDEYEDHMRECGYRYPNEQEGESVINR